MVAEVIINRNSKKLNRTFDYNIPKELEDVIIVGSKVLVPFGKSGLLEEAFVMKIKEKSTYQIKDINSLKENLSKEQIDLATWMAKTFFSNTSECIKLMLTPGTRTKNIEKRTKDKKINVINLNKTSEEIKDDIDTKKVKSKKQIKVLEFMKKNYLQEFTISEIMEFADCSRAIINTLIKNGYLKVSEKIINRNPLLFKNVEKSNALTLTSEQQIAYEKIVQAIEKNIYKSFLLYGVTGAGKTEIYLQLIQNVIEKGRTAILLVPEISLTPQIIDRFVARFGKEKIAVLHSKLSVGERHDEWECIRSGEKQIVIGARSAIFAPLKNLGIVIIDEEHDSSYKSESDPRYETKQVAKYICEKAKCPLILGSATPSIDDYYNTIKNNNKDTEILTLTKRANNSALPKVDIIDLKLELASGNRSMLSTYLYTEIENNLKQKKQTILFLNRRGYSTFIMCRNCGYTAQCKNCNISLTYHSFEKKLKCHYCGHEENLIKICPECKSDKIRYFGTGTQKLEQEINKLFPMAKTIRMDVDTVSKKNSHELILNKFKNDNIDILIGTQMVVKGHHFPNVTLVGVIAADSSLNIDDYRANERTFQILTQVAGRAGRENLLGKVIIQSYNPDNFAIQCSKKQDYNLFYETEIELRKQLKYPPFGDIILINFKSDSEQDIAKLSNWFYNQTKKRLNNDKYQIFKPMPSPIDKIQNKIRWRMIIKGNADDELRKGLNNIVQIIYDKNYNKVQVYIDVNPNTMY